MARPVKYKEWISEDGLQKIEEWARNGLTNAQVAKSIGVSNSTFAEWRKQFSELSEALKNGRKPLIEQLENTLVKKAMGYTEVSQKIIEQHVENGEIVSQKVKTTKTTYPPDNASLIFKLKNLDPERYRDRPRNEIEKRNIELENKLKEVQLKQMRLEEASKEAKIYSGIPANKIAPCFSKLLFDIENKEYREFVLPGGRGSTKSSFLGLETIDLIEKNPDFHALILRNFYSTIKDSVFAQIKWAIAELGLLEEYTWTKSPYEIVKKSTGQTIYFRGADDPTKIKSIKPTFGHIGVLWFEELDQYRGADEIRSIEESAIRGGDEVYEFKSFNPPKSKNNWVNLYVTDIESGKEGYEDAHVYWSNYLDVPKRWLGEPFLKIAENLKKVNPAAYANEYMGEANGSGGNVLPNIVERRITEEEISGFDDIVTGVDFGWVHPSAFIRAQYFPAQQRIIVFDEGGGSFVKNKDLAQQLKDHGVGRQDLVVCDNAEPKSISYLQDQGIRAVKALKGPNSRAEGFKFLASQIEIVVDPNRTPNFYKQAINLEYDRDKEGNITSQIPKIDDDWVDALRYATEQYMKRQYSPFD